MKRLRTAAALCVALGLATVGTPAAHADFSGIQNYSEWSNVQPPERRGAVNDDCNCSGAWTGNDGTRDGDYWREFEYLHSEGFSLIYYRQADDGTWRVFWKKRWVEYDGPDQTVWF